MARSWEKRSGCRAILRNLLIREPRLPFNPTGRRCLNGRSTRKGEKGTRWPGRVGLELGTVPKSHSPLLLTGSLRSTWTPPPPHTHRLLECPYSLSWSSETYLSFPHLGFGNRGLSLETHHERKGLPEKTQREDRYQSVWRQGPCLPPTPGEVRCHLRALSQPELLPKPTAPSYHPSPSVPTVTVFNGRN